MKKTIIVLGVITAGLISLIACTNGANETSGDVVISQDSLVNRGKYLVNAIGCDDCHSPKVWTDHGPQIDMENRFGGHPSNAPIGAVNASTMKDWVLFSPGLTAFAGPWGVSYAANISGDDTGIGNWTEEQFFRAIREGKSKGLKDARPLLPPMPWEAYRNLSDVDLKSIYLYLKSTKPVNNRVPGPKSLEEVGSGLATASH